MEKQDPDFGLALDTRHARMREAREPTRCRPSRCRSAYIAGQAVRSARFTYDVFNIGPDYEMVTGRVLCGSTAADTVLT